MRDRRGDMKGRHERADREQLVETLHNSNKVADVMLLKIGRNASSRTMQYFQPSHKVVLTVNRSSFVRIPVHSLWGVSR